MINNPCYYIFPQPIYNLKLVDILHPSQKTNTIQNCSDFGHKDNNNWYALISYLTSNHNKTTMFHSQSLFQTMHC